MNEHPIIFSTEMVRAILDGRKTMTRRVINHPERYEHIRECDFCCPYGQVGDKLWVRESFLIKHDYKTPKGFPYYKTNFCDDKITKWKPSIFMPRWASRITLEITGIRVERLQEISEQDAKDEGICFYDDNAVDVFRELWDSINAKRGYSWESNPFVWVIEFKWMK